jgi:hypothetical protein
VGRAAHAGQHAVFADQHHVVIEVLAAIPEHLAGCLPDWAGRITILEIVAVQALAKSKNHMDIDKSRQYLSSSDVQEL